jgi:protein-disulfide isomerase
MKRTLPFVIIAAVLLAGLATAWYLQRSTAETPAAPPPTNASTPVNSTSTPAQPAQSALGAQPPHVLGSPSAPVRLEEFGDFQCPPCGQLHPILKSLEAEFGSAKLQIIFREFPLVPNHVHALAAARAAEAAGLQGRFWEMHDIIYEHQADWKEVFDARPIFEGYAKTIGLDLEQFNRDVNNEIVQRRIDQDGIRAHSLGVQGTPTVFLNGREVPFQSLAPDKLKALINAELAGHP